MVQAEVNTYEAGAIRRAAEISVAGARMRSVTRNIRRRDGSRFDDLPVETIERHGGAEIVSLRDIEASRGKQRALRVSSAWRPDTLYKRGCLTCSQYACACKLRGLYENGGCEGYARSPTRERVDGGPKSARVHSDARRQFFDAMDTLPPAMREVVASVVLDNRTVGETARSLQMNTRVSGDRKRADTVMAQLRAGLDHLDKHFAEANLN